MRYHYLIGGSGIPNYGDELIALAWVSVIQRKRPNDKIFLDVTDAEASKAIVGGRSVDHVEILRHIAKRGAKESFWDNIARGLRFFDDDGPTHHPNIKVLTDNLDNLATFHVFGGGYMNKRWPYAAFYLGLGAAIKKRSSAKVVATGLGLMPLPSPETPEQKAAAREIIKAFDLIEVRDAESARAYPGTMAGLDDAFLSPKPQLANSPSTLHVAISFAEQDWSAFARDLVDRTANDWSPAFDRVLFWNCAPQKDTFALGKFREAIPSIEVIDVSDLVRGRIAFGTDDAMVATRFHPHMMAARAGVPGAFRFGNGYYSTKHGSVLALGSGFKLIDDQMRSLPDDRGTLRLFDHHHKDHKRAMVAAIYR